MTVKCMSRAIWLSIWINMQNDPCNLSPVGALSIGIEQTQISHQMLLIVARQRRVGRRHVSNIGIKRRIPHLPSFATRMGHPSNELTGK